MLGPLCSASPAAPLFARLTSTASAQVCRKRVRLYIYALTAAPARLVPLPQESAKALFDFNGKEKGQISIKKGEILTVVSKEERHKGWRQVRSQDGARTGYVPANYIGQADDRKVFGVALADIMARQSEQQGGGGVPRFVAEIIARMEELGGATCSGIFRWPGSSREVQAICEAYDKGKRGPEVTGLSANAVDFATVLQRWNRSLPDGTRISLLALPSVSLRWHVCSIARLLQCSARATVHVPCAGKKLVPWDAGSPEMANLVRLGRAPEGSYEEHELLDVVAQLPPHHREVFERQMAFMREIDYVAADM